jgi:hypothetical protein
MSKKKFTKRKKERKEFFITAVKGEWQLIMDDDQGRLVSLTDEV